MPSPVSPAKSPNRVALIAWALWIIAVLAILIHVGLKPHSNTLYKVFHDGGARWMASQNLYPKVDEYIYSPFAAAFFAPFTLLPDSVAGILWRVLTIGVYAGACFVWIRRERRADAGAQGFAWIIILPLSVGDLFNGQANPLVIGLLMLAIMGCREHRYFAAALCVGVATYFKIYPLAVGMLLAVLHPRFAWRLVAALVGIFCVSLLLQRPPYVLQQYSNWLHSLGQDPRRTLNYYGTYRDFWLILRVLRVPISVGGWSCLQVLAGGALAGYLFLLKRRGSSPELLDFTLLLLGTAWMLLFGPATESSTYVILAPAVAMALLRWRCDCGLCSAAWASFALLTVSQMITAWAHQHQNACTHLVQPVGALVLTVAAIVWAQRMAQHDLAPAGEAR
jgi:hypothetical protein